MEKTLKRKYHKVQSASKKKTADWLTNRYGQVRVIHKNRGSDEGDMEIIAVFDLDKR